MTVTKKVAALFLTLMMVLPACMPAQPKQTASMDKTESSTEAAALTEAIRPRLQAIWQHYKNQEAAAHNALLADDYQAVGPDGTLRNRKPMPQEIAEAPLTAYTLVQVKAAPLGRDAALVTYTAEVDGPSGGKIIHVTYQVGEVWVRQEGEWKCRYYHGTPVIK
ncbi:MAG TPA: nuclear transport factor 2 family protein [Terriglobales bacterium]|nr:nuclear transport factor 2 family protein [Terriglobales bacterium]